MLRQYSSIIFLCSVHVTIIFFDNILMLRPCYDNILQEAFRIFYCSVHVTIIFFDNILMLRPCYDNILQVNKIFFGEYSSCLSGSPVSSSFQASSSSRYSRSASPVFFSYRFRVTHALHPLTVSLGKCSLLVGTEPISILVGVTGGISR